MDTKLILEIALYLGFIASALTSIAYLPGALKTIRTHDTRGISWQMFLLTFSRSLIWFVFGFVVLFIPDRGPQAGIPIILVNCVISPASFIIFFIKIKNIRLAKKNNTTEEIIVVRILREKNKC